MKTRPHVVVQGEYLSKLAALYGFDPKTVWHDAKNDELRQKRPDPEVLCPGDILYVPEKPQTSLPITIGSANTFEGRVPSVKLIARFRDDKGPLANEPYEVPQYGLKGTTDAQGQIDVEVPVVDHGVEVLLTQRGWSRTFNVGDLDPIEESSGVTSRLRHLGYLHAVNDPEAERQAVRLFQTDRGLNVTGIVDAATADALTKAHEGAE
jgi:hypothetical protein